jgi:hypothetical protein
MIMSEENEIEEFGDPNIRSYDHKVPTVFKIMYCILPIWGIIWLCLFWNGSHGWLDRGHWGALQKAANTTFIEGGHK